MGVGDGLGCIEGRWWRMRREGKQMRVGDSGWVDVEGADECETPTKEGFRRKRRIRSSLEERAEWPGSD